MATEFSQPIYSNNMTGNNSLMDNFFTGTIKSEFKEEQPSIDLDDSEFDRVLDQVPSFDQYLMNNNNNIINSPYNSYEFSIAPSLLHSPSSSSLLSSDSLSLSSIASSSSCTSSSLSSLPAASAPSALPFVKVALPTERILYQPNNFFSHEKKPLHFEQNVPNDVDEIPAAFIISSTSSSSPPPLLLRPQSLSLACFDIKKHDTISSYLENIDLDENSR